MSRQDLTRRASLLLARHSSVGVFKAARAMNVKPVTAYASLLRLCANNAAHWTRSSRRKPLRDTVFHIGPRPDSPSATMGIVDPWMLPAAFFKPAEVCA